MRPAAPILALALCTVFAATSVAKPRIVFERMSTRGHATRANLFTMKPDGTDAFQVTHSRAPVLNTSPDWRSDHTRIVFQSAREGTVNLWTVKSNGNRLRRLTHGDRLDADPAWSPDGKRIAFARATRRAGDGQSPFDLFTIHPDGSGLRRVTHGGASARSPDWSRDGRALAFQRTAGGDPPQIWRIARDGTHRKRLTAVANGAYSPAWSPDGRLVAFSSPKGLAFEIFVVPAAGGAVRQVTDDRGGTFNGDPAWSPDSDHIVFSTSHSPPGGSSIARIKPNGHGRHLIKGDRTGRRVYGAPAWG